MLGRAGISAVLIDPHTAYPPDFRCEKLDGSQVELLRKTGLAEDVLAGATLDEEISIARFGRLVEKRSARQYGIMYDTLVNAFRALIPPTVEFLHAKATAIAAGTDRQIVTLSTDEQVAARLVVLSNGLNIGLRHNLGITREIISEGHSIAAGFNVEPSGTPRFDFKALTYFPEHTSDRMAYFSLFPIHETMRGNLFVYRDMQDPWLRQLRKTPEETLIAAMPGLKNLTGNFTVTGDIRIRPVDLYVSKGHRQPGVVLVGDAFATSCPAAGTGANKVFTDVERLCNLHIPRWLESDGMGVEKIAAFYDDPVKKACDAASVNKAFYLRGLSVDTGPSWRARRWVRGTARLALGVSRRILAARLPDRRGVALDGGGAG
jgi:2-polyprenyl-6-methoxyphenol hydroxylase-like FAD-dependent oxidoreductase